MDIEAQLRIELLEEHIEELEQKYNWLVDAMLEIVNGG